MIKILAHRVWRYLGAQPSQSFSPAPARNRKCRDDPSDSGRGPPHSKSFATSPFRTYPLPLFVSAEIDDRYLSSSVPLSCRLRNCGCMVDVLRFRASLELSRDELRAIR